MVALRISPTKIGRIGARFLGDAPGAATRARPGEWPDPRHVIGGGQAGQAGRSEQELKLQPQQRLAGHITIGDYATVGGLVAIHRSDRMRTVNVAADVDILPKDRANAIDVTLREYRNVIHSDVELKKKYSCTEAEASLAKGALDAVCNYLDGHALHLRLSQSDTTP